MLLRHAVAAVRRQCSQQCSQPRAARRFAASPEPTFGDLARRLGAAEGAAAPRRAPARRKPLAPAAERLEARHRRGLGVVLLKAQARVEYALAAAFDERRRRGDRALDAVHVSEVRLAPDFRQANVYWHLDAAETAARAPRPPSRFFGDPLPGDGGPAPEDAAAPRRRAEAALARAAPALRIAVARRARLRFATDLRFQYDARASAERFSPDHLGASLGRDLDDGAA